MTLEVNAPEPRGADDIVPRQRVRRVFWFSFWLGPFGWFSYKKWAQQSSLALDPGDVDDNTPSPSGRTRSSERSLKRAWLLGWLSGVATALAVPLLILFLAFIASRPAATPDPQAGLDSGITSVTPSEEESAALNDGSVTTEVPQETLSADGLPPINQLILDMNGCVGCENSIEADFPYIDPADPLTQPSSLFGPTEPLGSNYLNSDRIAVDDFETVFYALVDNDKRANCTDGALDPTIIPNIYGSVTDLSVTPQMFLPADGLPWCKNSNVSGVEFEQNSPGDVTFTYLIGDGFGNIQSQTRAIYFREGWRLIVPVGLEQWGE